MWEEYKPHVLMTFNYFVLAIFLVLLQSLMTNGGVSSLVFVVYEHFVSTLLLSLVAFFLERDKRPAFTLEVFCSTFFLGALEIPLCQLLLTSSLSYITATLQSTALNTISAVTFVIAVIFGLETFRFRTLNGQAKLWGITLSAFGATMMVLWVGPKLGGLNTSNIGKEVIGSTMLVCAIIATASWNILVEQFAIKYPAAMSLAAMMCFWGTIQTTMIAVLTERNASNWRISLHDSYQLPVILYGGIVVTGISFYAQTWCIRKRGPLFTTGFSPLLVVFSFILETLILKKAVHLGSIIGAVFVITGLYLLLWAKADDTGKKKLEGNLSSPLIDSYEQ